MLVADRSVAIFVPFFVGENVIGLPLVRKKRTTWKSSRLPRRHFYALFMILITCMAIFFRTRLPLKWRAKVTGCLVVNLHPFKDVGTVNL